MTGGHSEVSAEGPAGQPALWPSSWAVKVENTQDRWTVGIPHTELLRKQLTQFDAQNLVRPTGYQAQSPGTYATLKHTPTKGPVKKATLKTELIPGSDLPGLKLSPAVFGRAVGVVDIEPGSLFAYRRARMLTSGMAWQVASIIMGIVSAGIVACFTIGAKMAHPWVIVSSGTVFCVSLVGAGLAAAAPLVKLVGDKWFVDGDVPD